MATASANPATTGTVGLSWSQMTKRYRDVMDEIFTRCKNKHPFVLLAKHRDSEDGVYIYFTQLFLFVPTWDPVKKKWIPANQKNRRLFQFNLGGGGIGSVSNLHNYIAEATGITPQNLNKEGVAGPGAPAWNTAPVKVQFATSKSPTLSQTINSSWILKDGTIYGNSVEGLGGKAPKGTIRQVKWGKLALLSEPPLNINYNLNYPSATEDGESAFISDFNSQLEQIAGANGGRGLDMKIGNTVYTNIIGVNKVAGSGKADLVFVALQNRQLVEVCWASHKKGSKAKDFGQWGGMTDLYKTDNTVKAFVDYMKEIVGIGNIIDFTTFSSGITIGMKIDKPQHANLRKFAVYGKQPNGSFGPHKCNVVLQGDPTITYGRSHSTLSMSGHLVNFPTEMTGPYEPVLMCIKKASTENILAGKGRADLGIQGARLSVFPYGEKTRVTHWVEQDSDGNLFLSTPVV